jgi:hypothetical protein
MSSGKGAAATGIDSGPTLQRTAAKSKQPRVARKWQRWLRAVLESPKTSRELELPPVFDHVAHSTASEVRKRGINVITEMVTIRGYCGEPARVARYSIAADSVEMARRLIGEQP